MDGQVTTEGKRVHLVTDPEALVIGRLISLHFGPGAQIEPKRIFPEGDADRLERIEDWACRQILHLLWGKRLLQRTMVPGLKRFPDTAWILTQEAVDAYRGWYERRGYKGEDGSALLP